MGVDLSLVVFALLLNQLRHETRSAIAVKMLWNVITPIQIILKCFIPLITIKKRCERSQR
jgi:hypothetical protein